VFLPDVQRVWANLKPGSDIPIIFVNAYLAAAPQAPAMPDPISLRILPAAWGHVLSEEAYGWVAVGLALAALLYAAVRSRRVRGRYTALDFWRVGVGSPRLGSPDRGGGPCSEPRERRALLYT